MREPITITLPLWTIIIRATKQPAAPSLDGVDGPILPLYTQEEFADQSAEEHAGLDPYRIGTVAQLRHILAGVDACGGKWVALDGGIVKTGKLFAVKDMLATLDK